MKLSLSKCFPFGAATAALTIAACSSTVPLYPIEPQVVGSSALQKQGRGGGVFHSSSLGAVYLDYYNKQSYPVNLLNVTFGTSGDACRFEMANEIKIEPYSMVTLKIAERDEIEACHPLLVGYFDVLSSKSRKLNHSRSIGVGAALYFDHQGGSSNLLEVVKFRKVQ